jgi:acetone carboxylase gamma subunit
MGQRRVHEYLLLEDDGARGILRCAKCGFEYCGSTEDYRLFSLAYERPVTDIHPCVPNPRKLIDEDWFFREYYCPGCGVMIDNELVREGEEPKPKMLLK